MADSLHTQIATHVADGLDAIEDLNERFKVSRAVEDSVAAALKGVRQRIAQQYRELGKTWRETGEVMGGVTAQRAEQISRGK